MSRRTRPLRLNFGGDRERARSLLRTAILSQLERLPASEGAAIIRDRRGLAIELVETLTEPQYADALQLLSEGRR
jgi:hypothetical protein